MIQEERFGKISIARTNFGILSVNASTLRGWRYYTTIAQLIKKGRYKMVKLIIILTLALFVLVCNVIVAAHYTPKQMKSRFIDNQCIVGRIAAALFYAPAWFLKALKWLITATVA